LRKQSPRSLTASQSGDQRLCHDARGALGEHAGLCDLAVSQSNRVSRRAAEHHIEQSDLVHSESTGHIVTAWLK
jgi:hypothetical protein